MGTISVEKLAEMLGIVKHGHWIKKINPNYSPFDPWFRGTAYLQPMRV